MRHDTNIIITLAKFQINPKHNTFTETFYDQCSNTFMNHFKSSFESCSNYELPDKM